LGNRTTVLPLSGLVEACRVPFSKFADRRHNRSPASRPLDSGTSHNSEHIMVNRRGFICKAIMAVAGAGFLTTPVRFLIDLGRSETGKTLVPGDTPWTALRNRNPKDLDTSNLAITPLKDFGTMGLEDYSADVSVWRLIVEGEVDKPLQLTYAEVMGLPAVERAVLMICPGFFANRGLWTGVSIRELLKMAGIKKGVTHVTIRGPEGPYEKVLRVPISDVHSDTVFLAYKVNGTTLPQKHGFPLRVVAEGYYGFDWVKYVYKVTADMIES